MTQPQADLMQLLSRIDTAKLAQVAGRIDLPALLDAASCLDDAQLAQLEKMLQTGQKGQKAKEAPEANGDFYDLSGTLTEKQRDVQQRIRDFMLTHVQPIANEYWSTDTFPQHLIPKFRELDLLRLSWNDDGTRTEDASIIEGLTSLEMARVDVSTATFFGVHGGLALGSIAVGGSDEQKREWIPKMLDMQVMGAFGLTEPDVGSAAAGGLTTTARRDGDTWVLNGEKKWIGNATFADIVVIWARDEHDGEVKGFIVRTDNPGYSVKKIEGKIALRMVENGHITLKDCRVPEHDRLQNASSFRATADVLRLTRAGVAWQAVGCATGAYERALRYTHERQQFGRPIASFQLIQQHLVTMLGNITAMRAMCMRLSQLQDQDLMRDEHASLAKVFTAARCRETVALGREIMGGNGILLEHDMARFFADTEAIYSYEGTNEINSLVVGRAITGISAFV